MKKLTSSLVITLSILLFSACTTSKTNDTHQTPTWHTEKLSRENCTWVLVDFLTGFDPGVKTIDTLTFYHNVTAYAKIGEIFKLPTIVLGDEGDFRGVFYSSVRKHAPNATYIKRETPSAWRVDAFQEFLAKTGRKKVVLGGISLDNCTLQTSIDLLNNGYQVYVCVDVSPAESELVQQAALLRLQQAGAVLVTWGSIAGEIMGDWRTPEGAAVGQLYQDHSVYGGPLKPIQR
ncbi:MAG: isochorismatase family protein [Cytophagia bacterium]|nr:isochorismatase family protein [Cytophagia bacterium]